MTSASRLLSVIAALACFAGCQGDAPERQHATLGSVGYDIPVDWSRADRGPRMSIWTPGENSRKESVTVIRADLDPALAKAGPSAIEPLLIKAQGTLPRAHVSTPEPITTAHGLQGFRVAVEFTPFAGKPPYTRIHTIVIDGATLVHVLYTAASPDPESQAMKMVLETAHKEG